MCVCCPIICATQTQTLPGEPEIRVDAAAAARVICQLLLWRSQIGIRVMHPGSARTYLCIFVRVCMSVKPVCPSKPNENSLGTDLRARQMSFCFLAQAARPGWLPVAESDLKIRHMPTQMEVPLVRGKNSWKGFRGSAFPNDMLSGKILTFDTSTAASATWHRTGDF